jgi:pilus assembly protein CpaE
MLNERNGSDPFEGPFLTVAILDSDVQRRKGAAEALAGNKSLQVTEISSFPATAADLAQLLPQTYNVVLFNVDCDRDLAFDLAEGLSANPRSYVMAYSSRTDMKMAVHVMRAGAREFFTTPVDPAEIAAAMRRAAEHYASAAPAEPKTASRLFVFLGTKGGCGVTTLAANFALALADDSAGQTLLIDFGLPLGDAAINLGIKTEYSVVSAMQLTDRLDAGLLAQLVVKHSTGLSVLASPSEFSDTPTPLESIDKLVTVARGAYDFVVVDVGSRIDLLDTSLFDKSAIVYLITQVGISEMLNANRMVSKFFFTRDHTLQIVINRYKPSDLLFDEKKITEALTRPAQWKIPDDYAAARRTRETASPMVLVDSAISRAIREMAKSASGSTGEAEKDAKRGFFSFLR